MHKYLEKESEISFDKIFNQILGEYNIYICIHNIFFFIENWLQQPRKRL